MTRIDLLFLCIRIQARYQILRAIRQRARKQPKNHTLRAHRGGRMEVCHG